MTFAERLKMHRVRLRLTQAEAARLLGVSARPYWSWEAGRTEPYEVTQEGVVARLEQATPKAKTK